MIANVQLNPLAGCSCTTTCGTACFGMSMTATASTVVLFSRRRVRRLITWAFPEGPLERDLLHELWERIDAATVTVMEMATETAARRSDRARMARIRCARRRRGRRRRRRWYRGRWRN